MNFVAGGNRMRSVGRLFRSVPDERFLAAAICSIWGFLFSFDLFRRRSDRMTSTRTRLELIVRSRSICLALAMALTAVANPAQAVVRIFDGFGDADRNNDGVVGSYDTDLNDSGTFNDPTADAALIARGITEVTAAQDPTDVGVVWSATRAYDTTTNLVKAKLRIFNDNVPVGSEDSSQIFNHGLALGVESRGGGSSFIGKFGQNIAVGPNAGDKLVASVNFRSWAESNAPTTASIINEIRWGLFQDTDHELGMTAPYGSGFASGSGATVTWGQDDGNWFASQPGAEGDKGIWVSNEFGSNLAAPTNARVKWEYNLAGINGSSNNGRILEGNGTSNGGDIGTIASPTGDGPGGIFNDTSLGPHLLSIQITRLADGLLNVAYSIDNVQILADDIKTTDSDYAVLNPPADSFDYVAFRNTADYDFAIDDFKVETFSATPVGVAGDYNGNGVVDMADYVLWRNGGPLANEVADQGSVSAADYTEWRARFGNTSGSGASLGGGAVPEPASVLLLLMVGLLAAGSRRTDRS